MPIVSRSGFVVREFKPYSKNSLVGFLVLELPSGLVNRDVMLHEKADARWVSMPAKQYERDGERTWAPLVEFSSKEAREEFQASALATFDAYMAEVDE
jgi:hypothetical protein